ncbi:MAG: TolC family protein [Bacteroidia bacterium]|nr:TolC family protein [Bacteroidia bacterium]
MIKNKFIIYLLLSNFGIASDSIFISFEQILASVRAFHPIVQKIALTRPALKNSVRLARGQFDPSILSQFDEKNFNEKQYFSKWYHELKVPTQFGVDFKGSIDANSGIFLNNEDFTDDGTMLSLGVEVPAGRNLFFNERRLALQQAKVLQNAGFAIQNQFLNIFLKNLGTDFAEWLFSFRKLKLYTDAYKLAKERYEFMLQRIQYGDEAPIDSTEMSIQIQFIAARLADTKAEYALKKAKMNTYLWNADEKPLEMNENMYPAIGMDAVKKIHDSIYITDPLKILQNNPELIATQAELKTLELATRYAKFQLLPDVYIGYSILNTWSDPLPVWNYRENNKWNGYLYFPLLLRKERAKIQLNKIKEREKELELLQKTRELELKIKAMKEQYLQMSNQHNIFLLALKNSILLRDAEKTKFYNGESSVFLINVRENSLLDMNVRYFDNEMRIQQFYFDFLSTCGILYLIM